MNSLNLTDKMYIINSMSLRNLLKNRIVFMFFIHLVSIIRVARDFECIWQNGKTNKTFGIVGNLPLSVF